MKNNLTQETNSFKKKVWAKPQVWVLDTADDVSATKHVPSVREATGHGTNQVSTDHAANIPGASYFAAQHNVHHVFNKSSAVS